LEYVARLVDSVVENSTGITTDHATLPHADLHVQTVHLLDLV